MYEDLDPTLRIDVDFERWRARRQRRQAAHLVDGIPDYAFSWDLQIRRQLEAIPALRSVAQALNSGVVPIQRALREVSAVAVGPNQLPKIHGMGVACAERLGIGVPQIFIMQDPILNAFTFATGDVDQLVVLTSGLVQALDEEELQFVIGHECGHIHNRHVVYNTLWEILTNQVALGLLGRVLTVLGPLGTLIHFGFSVSTRLVFGRWHRCAEFTCDRAGLICTPNPAAAERVNAKLHMGGIDKLEGFDPVEYERQARTYSKSWLRAKELFETHPPGPRRAEAIRRYRATDVFASWRPELRGDGPLVPQADVDAEIGKLFL
jgi:Zn-dependent protease with chaperone function